MSLDRLRSGLTGGESVSWVPKTVVGDACVRGGVQGDEGVCGDARRRFCGSGGVDVMISVGLSGDADGDGREKCGRRGGEVKVKRGVKRFIHGVGGCVWVRCEKGEAYV